MLTITATGSDRITSRAEARSATALTASISAAATTIPVTSTSGFMSKGFLEIDGESIFYQQKTATAFIDVIRASTATSHSSGASINQSTVGGVYELNLTIQEDDPDLEDQLISATVDFGDDIDLPVIIPAQSSPINVTLFNVFHAGDYHVAITARNYRFPTPDEAMERLRLIVEGDLFKRLPPSAFIGPIIPRDQGFPDAKQWHFNIANDIRILESSIKMLLITSTGERLMQPDYGTNLRRIIFEHEQDVVETLAQEEIVRAVNRFEPRVQVQAVRVTRPDNGRDVFIQALFLSKLNNQRFVVNTAFQES